ncbi:MAG: zinc ABC transporter substrate-binding protein, partial [Desulfuromonadales bacterium]|nr:zinc ABC transporter substrate-binding protein [Desulfuromonadales bacterium]
VERFARDEDDASAVRVALRLLRYSTLPFATERRLLDLRRSTGAAADRAHGDVHPAGNPHINMDPMRMAEVARALAGRLASLYPAGEKVFAENAERFGRQVAERLPMWQSRIAKAPGVVMFHKDANYLLNLLGVPVLGYIEPLPGIPPTAQHLQSLVTELQSRSGVVIRIVYQSAQGPEFVGRALNWPVHALPLDPPLDADAEDYLKLIDRWVDTLAGKN